MTLLVEEGHMTYIYVLGTQRVKVTLPLILKKVYKFGQSCQNGIIASFLQLEH